MAKVIVEVSKYLIIMLMAVYTLECFTVFKHGHEEDRNGIYIRQNIFMFLIHFIAFIVLCLETKDLFLIVFYCVQQTLLFAIIALYRFIYPKSNRLVVNNMCLLLSISFIILTRLSLSKSKKQFIIVVISIIITMFIPYLIQNLKLIKYLTFIYAGVGITTLGGVMLLGTVTNGSKISYTIGGVTFQPSEFVKIIYVFCIAGLLCQSVNLFKVFISAVIASIHVMILVLSKDLGSALIFFVVYVMMLYVATGRAFYLWAGLLGGSTAAVIAHSMFRHVQIRVTAWKDPFSVIEEAGFQMAQSLFAIGTGGWFGMGLYQGAPNKIPIVEADFVFAAISEELGGVFGLCLILVCVSCFIMFMNISMRIKDPFYKLVAFGLGITYGFQVFITIGGVTKFIPLTGVTLPLVSYGGSSILTTLIMFAIIQGLYITRQNEGDESETAKSKAKKNRRKAPSGRTAKR